MIGKAAIDIPVKECYLHDKGNKGETRSGMGIRGCERIHVLINITINCGNSTEPGTLMNLSEKGMFIRMNGKLPPPCPVVEVIIPLKEEKIQVPVRVIRTETINGLYQGIGVEIVSPSQRYLDFLDQLLAVL